ncbi:UbiA prenyltransferase family protein [Streptomyces sp. NBRC 110028]|uniref:UbiA prenyltransferase family protein n=1 Tax=Streptomyces sp. NBRC 110028 TaxID=1621260 RepID=UPI0006E3C5A3|nr:UbiA prenyltransferase family protein [Streptomyces sp. NBRC 110028]
MNWLGSDDIMDDQGGPAATASPGTRAAVPTAAPTMPTPEPVRATNGSHGPLREGTAGAEPRRSRLPAPLVLLRPRQWVKNIFVLIVPLAVDPAVFWHRIAWALVTAVAFTAASGAVYVLNDWLDREQDRLHPVKRHRPLASGQVGPLGALLLGAGCLGIAATLGALLPPPVRAAVVGYAVLNLAYCLVLKNYPLVDVSVVALGFVLRAVAGCLAVAAPFSPTLIICVYCTCLLMSLGKRRHELVTASLRGQAAAQRPALAGYSVPLLDQLTAVLLAATLISYELFILSAPQPHAAVLAVVTVPFAVFALCRYTQLLSVHRSGGEPGRDVLMDMPLMINAALWLICLAVGRLV